MRVAGGLHLLPRERRAPRHLAREIGCDLERRHQRVHRLHQHRQRRVLGHLRGLEEAHQVSARQRLPDDARVCRRRAPARHLARLQLALAAQPV